jgi:protein O-GlcNAc transferase
MDTSRFAAELPGLFDDYPRSEHPRGRRFDDLVEGIPNLATENTLALINLAASCLGPGESYVEAGSYMGASLIAASRDNPGIDLVAIDYFSFGPLTVAGRELPPASRAAFEANVQRFGVEATLFEGDTVEVLRGGALAGRNVGVFFYDACHDYEPQLEALTLVEPFLADEALLIVDNYDWEDPRRAVHGYLAQQPRARLLVEVAGAGGGQDWWWDGTAVLAWGARASRRL